MVPATAFKEDRRLTKPSEQHEEQCHGDVEDVEDAVQLRQFRPFLGLVPELPRGLGFLLLLRCLLFGGRATSLFKCRRDGAMGVNGRDKAQTLSSKTKSKSYLIDAALVAGFRCHDDGGGERSVAGASCVEKGRE